MAYMNQEKKAKLAPGIKEALTNTGEQSMEDRIGRTFRWIIVNGIMMFMYMVMLAAIASQGWWWSAAMYVGITISTGQVYRVYANRSVAKRAKEVGIANLPSIS